MRDFHAATVFAGANTHERDTVAMARIHVCLNLENETGQLVFIGLYPALLGFACERSGCVAYEFVKQLFNAEVRQGGTEKHGRLPPIEIVLNLEFGTRAFDEFELFAKFRGNISECFRGSI